MKSDIPSSGHLAEHRASILSPNSLGQVSQQVKQQVRSIKQLLQTCSVWGRWNRGGLGTGSQRHRAGNLAKT